MAPWKFNKLFDHNVINFSTNLCRPMNLSINFVLVFYWFIYFCSHIFNVAYAAVLFSSHKERYNDSIAYYVRIHTYIHTHIDTHTNYNSNLSLCFSWRITIFLVSIILPKYDFDLISGHSFCHRIILYSLSISSFLT